MPTLTANLRKPLRNRAVSGAYYAMLYAARAALNEAGKAPKSHQGVQHQLWET